MMTDTANLTSVAKHVYKDLINADVLSLPRKIKKLGYNVTYFANDDNPKTHHILTFASWGAKTQKVTIALNVMYIETIDFLRGLFLALILKQAIHNAKDFNKFEDYYDDDFIIFKDKRSQIQKSADYMANVCNILDKQKI